MSFEVTDLQSLRETMEVYRMGDDTISQEKRNLYRSNNLEEKKNLTSKQVANEYTAKRARRPKIESGCLTCKYA